MTPSIPTPEEVEEAVAKALPLLNGALSNVPHDFFRDQRIVGFRVHEDIAGLSEGLFLLEAVRVALRAVPGLLSTIQTQASEIEGLRSSNADLYRQACAASIRAGETQSALDEALEAMEPFARFVKAGGLGRGNHLITWTTGPLGTASVTGDDFRRASEVHSRLTNREGGEG